MRRQKVLVDIPVAIAIELKDLSKTFTNVLLNIDSLYELQLKKELSLSKENSVWREIAKQLRTAEIPEDQKENYEEQIRKLEKGIFDLYPITVNSERGKADLIIGKVFASEGGSISYYSGVAGVRNNNYADVIEKYDLKLDKLCLELSVNKNNGQQSIKKKVPVIKCLDVFSLAGGINVSHKPICVFYSGDSPENISSLSNMTVFLNLYTSRFRALTINLAKRYLLYSVLLEELSDYEISMLLSIWLRGHDVGHFIGEDNLSEGMSEFDKDYMILHELKSDMIALSSFKLFSDDVLSNGLLEKIYYLSVAEMLRYIRRGNVLMHPDSASAYIAWRYFEHSGALIYDSVECKFIINLGLLEDSVSIFTKELLKIFEDGDPEHARQFVERFGSMETTNENDLSPMDCSGTLRRVINDTDIPHFIDYNFIINK
jgi:hypothetical protein